MADDEETDEFVHVDSPQSVVSEASGHSNEGDLEARRTISSTVGTEPSPEASPQPQPHPLKKRASIIRPTMETHINPNDFRKYRGQIKKRLSSKQRMPFETLVSRNYHGGLEDQLNETRPHQQSKKLLKLNRRLSFRPHPDEIQESSDLPKDLKIADSEYFKMYHYRDPNTEKERIVCPHCIAG